MMDWLVLCVCVYNYKEAHEWLYRASVLSPKLQNSHVSLFVPLW